MGQVGELIYNYTNTLPRIFLEPGPGPAGRGIQLGAVVTESKCPGLDIALFKRYFTNFTALLSQSLQELALLRGELIETDQCQFLGTWNEFMLHREQCCQSRLVNPVPLFTNFPVLF